MGAALYYLFFGINWLITLLPLPVLYLFSDLAFPVMYYVVRYRRKVVRTNLLNSFPGKNTSEIIEIEKKFYHHLCDLFIETFKLTHMSLSQNMKRMHHTNPEVLGRLFDEGKDVIAILGHFNNWEWLVHLPHLTRHKVVSIYKPLRDKHFDRFTNQLRKKYGMTLTPMSNVVREVVDLRNKNLKALFAFISDQTPPKGDCKFWTTFLNQDTPVYHGAEKIASRYNMTVIFFRIDKQRRGYYTFTTEVLFEQSKGLTENLITETHVRRLEEIIQENPQYWIWSHRRWKYKREEVNG